jgi:hypothetical protein
VNLLKGASLTLSLAFFFDHLNILLRADFSAKTAAFAIKVVWHECVLFLARDTAFRTDYLTEFTGNTVLL